MDKTALALFHTDEMVPVINGEQALFLILCFLFYLSFA